MSQDDLNQTIYLPNGSLNASFILANAGILLKAKEYALAEQMFKSISKHPKLAHCAYYGIGKCHLEQGNFSLAKLNFERAFSISRSAFIAKAITETLMQAKRYPEGESLSLQFAIEFSSDIESTETFRKYYLKFTELQRNDDRASNTAAPQS